MFLVLVKRMHVLRAILKHVPVKHVSNWHCENFVISKPHVKCKVLKHKILRIDNKSTTKLFFFFSVLNVGLLKMQ